MDKKEDNQKLDSSQYKTGKILLSWIAPEYEYYEKTTDWYWWVSLFAIILFVTAIWQKSFLFSVLVLIGWITIILYAARKPLLVKCALAERGVIVGDKLYFWQDLKSFWIFYNPPVRKDLVITSKRSIMPPLNIHLGSEDPMKIRELMIKFIPEIEQDESLIDSLARLARF
ncbi:MAG: hypothetical protein AAB795_03010 [Patescibacteria group bacterium]